jgi:hypothetical protein
MSFSRILRLPRLIHKHVLNRRQRLRTRQPLRKLTLGRGQTFARQLNSPTNTHNAPTYSQMHCHGTFSSPKTN